MQKWQKIDIGEIGPNEEFFLVKTFSSPSQFPSQKIFRKNTKSPRKEHKNTQKKQNLFCAKKLQKSKENKKNVFVSSPPPADNAGEPNRDFSSEENDVSWLGLVKRPQRYKQGNIVWAD